MCCQTKAEIAYTGKERKRERERQTDEAKSETKVKHTLTALVTVLTAKPEGQHPCLAAK